MLNATLFTSGLPVFLFVRDSRFLRVKAILSAVVVKVPRVPPARIRSFVYTPCSPPAPSKTISTSPAAARMACRGGHHSGVKRGCSVSGISSWDRKRHFVPSRSSPRRGVGSAPTNDHRRDQQVATKVQHEVFNPHPPSSSTPVANLRIFQPRNATSAQMKR